MFEIQDDGGIEISRLSSTVTLLSNHPSPSPIRSPVVSDAESEISFGTEFDRVFDMEIGSIATDKSWEDVRQLFCTPSCSSANGTDPNTSNLDASERWGNGRSSRMRLYGKHGGSESDLNQSFDDLTEEELADELFVSLRSVIRSRLGSGVYNTPLCRLLEDYATADLQELFDDFSDDDGSVRSESYYTRASVDDENSSLSPSPSPPGTTDNTPLAAISTWQFIRRM